MIDPKEFNDPVALQTQWTLIKCDGSKFFTHKLVKDSGIPEKIEFKLSSAAIFHYGFIILVGLVAVIVVLTSILKSGINSPAPITAIIATALGTLAAAAGAFILYTKAQRYIFDKHTGCFCIDGRRLNLKEIHAIQLVSKEVEYTRVRYTSYELNLILHDSSRIHIIKHGYQDIMRHDAKALGEFLEIPVWDAS